VGDEVRLGPAGIRDESGQTPKRSSSEIVSKLQMLCIQKI
jgi:hypothetical protein